MNFLHLQKCFLPAPADTEPHSLCFYPVHVVLYLVQYIEPPSLFSRYTSPGDTDRAAITLLLYYSLPGPVDTEPPPLC